MKISYLFSQFPVPTQTFAVSDIAALQELGHEVIVHTIKPPPKKGVSSHETSELKNDLKIYRPALSRVWRWPALLWRWRRQVVRLLGKCVRAMPRNAAAASVAILCLPRIFEIVEEIEESGSDVVHLFWSRHASLVLDVLADTKAPPVRSAFVGAYDLVADDFLVETAAESAVVLFSHTEANRPYLEGKSAPGKAIRIIHRGIPLVPPAGDVRRDPDVWISVSALVAAKNVGAVIRLFADTRASRPELRLRICGEGPERSKLEDLAAELGCRHAVQFMGHVDRSQVFELLQGAQLFLLLSTKASERLPNVVKEAMWCGCAIIISPTEGIAELVPDEQIGMIVDPANREALARAAASILGESEAAVELRRERVRALISDRFSSKGSMERYAAAWEEARRPVVGVGAQRDVS
ncbi:glycosyltransferase family 4 protein [Allopontixanthobacter sp.]|uniref:glycosyltransferase family 4 protein n=1 Tax=Allopontixanthobacter sp. TaxID=2906452 RepID=UPI002ABA1D3F|nr:glycosyltransferase family 4 protein [Allopontixanthobacter sp.]MDZ4307952.1 glycosyltransferase family 4 protein [Allopontixanthobacter sp.]